MRTRLLTALLLLHILAYASPGTITPYIKIDQFGYLPSTKKLAVIVDPQTGYNAAESFTPGTATNNYQVRRWTDDAVVFTGTLIAWNAGATHAQSGDRGWWFDFSSLTTPGSYYIFDLSQNKGSYRFEISTTAYSDVLRQAARTFFYQRLNFAKTTTYTDARWADAAAFEGLNQDRYARSRYDKTNPATAKDLHGGWMDAGDYNKYTSFTFAPLCTLLETYRLYPAVFADNYGIPESGNGVADIMDEIKWELDWLRRMQDASGTNGFYLKVGVDNYNAASPPSADANPRYYLGECTSATLTGAAVFALASIAYRQIGTPAMIAYADDLLARAQLAWSRALTTTSNFSSFQTTCDDGDIKAGDADISAAEQRDRAVTAAAYLYEATGLATYKTWFDNLYTQAQPYANWWWGPYYTAVQRALLRYASLPGATTTVSNNIRSMKAAQNGILSINNYNSATDLYRAYMPDDQYHWGSSQVKADAGVHNWDYVSFNLNTASHSLYKEVAGAYLHWFHGLNPMGRVLLSNMYADGGDVCADEIYHSWFANGTDWDNALTSLKGPPPGYVQGGPNKNFAIASITPPYGQPVQKAYKDWNTVWNGSFSEDSWEITEPAIYYQASYIALLARIIGDEPGTVLPVKFLDITGIHNRSYNTVRWTVAADENIKSFSIERSIDGRSFEVAGVITAGAFANYSWEDRGLLIASTPFIYRVKAVEADGSMVYSPLLRLGGAGVADWLQVSPNPSSGVVQLRVELKKAETLKVRVMNAAGAVVMAKTAVSAEGVSVFDLHVEDLPVGSYFIEVNGRWVRGRVKFLKS